MVGQVTVLAQDAAPAQLPTTAGGSDTPGVLWFVVAGLLLVAAGVLVLVVTRRQPMTR